MKKSRENMATKTFLMKEYFFSGMPAPSSRIARLTGNRILDRERLIRTAVNRPTATDWAVPKKIIIGASRGFRIARTLSSPILPSTNPTV